MSAVDDLAQRRADALDAAARHAARLVRAVGWLAVLADPGREPRPAPKVPTDAAARRALQRAIEEAADRRANLRAGLSAGAAASAPVDLAAVDATARAVRAVAAVVAAVGFGEPVSLANLVYVLDWLAGDGGPPCWAVTTAGVCYRRGVLAYPSWPVVVVEDAAAALRQAADTASQVAGITTERVVPFPGGRCPACGRRSLEIDATLRNERYWTVHCVSASCVCIGGGCGCRQQVRIEGRRHSWSYGELDGPWGLHQAIAARRASHPVGSTVAGHGGWAERRSDGNWPHASS